MAYMHFVFVINIVYPCTYDAHGCFVHAIHSGTQGSIVFTYYASVRKLFLTHTVVDKKHFAQQTVCNTNKVLLVMSKNSPVVFYVKMIILSALEASINLSVVATLP